METPQRHWHQFRLTTAILSMLIAGAMLGACMYSINVDDWFHGRWLQPDDRLVAVTSVVILCMSVLSLVVIISESCIRRAGIGDSRRSDGSSVAKTPVPSPP